jgi:hypothetical protein
MWSDSAGIACVRTRTYARVVKEEGTAYYFHLLFSYLTNKRYTINIVVIIISLLMSLLLGHRASLWITHKENGR